MAEDLSEKIYYNSPTWLQHIFTSLKGLEFRYRRADERIMREHFHFLVKSQYWNYEEFQKYQTQKLRELLAIAFSQVPYYQDVQKNLGCSLEDFQRPEDIRLLPILEKSQIRGNEQLFLNKSFDMTKALKGFTSGTTGTPLHLYDNREGFSRRWAFVARLRHWAGAQDPFYPRLAHFTGKKILPPEKFPTDNVYWRWNKPGNSLILSSYHITPATIPFYIRALKDYQPEIIDGFPSAFLALARMSKRLGLTLPVPKAIITTSETVLKDHRLEIEEAFHCQLFDQYAASEPSCFWCDCEKGVMHENSEYGISEIVNSQGKPVQPGELGDILVTSFLNPVMLLIRYKVGDMAVRGPAEPCACGRQMPRIAAIEGRKDDIFYIPARGYVGRLDAPFKGLKHIIESQIIQESLDHINILIVPTNDYAPDIGKQLVKNMHKVVGSEVTITIELVDQIARGANGKFQAQWSKVKHLYPDQMYLYPGQP